jgi:hypothetical protein
VDDEAATSQEFLNNKKLPSFTSPPFVY